MDNGSTPPLGGALADAGMGKIGYYMNRRHNSVAQCIDTQTIFDIAMADRRPGSLEIMFWWEQEGIQFRDKGRGTYELEVEWE